MRVQRYHWPLIALFALLLVACQPIQPVAAPDASAPPTVTFTAVESEAGYSYDGPTSVSGGLTRIEFANPGEFEHSLWAVKLDEGKSIEDFFGVLENIETNPEFPEWMTFYGGLTVAPGSTRAYTIDLVPSDYVLFSFSGMEGSEPDIARGMITMLSVSEPAPAAGSLTPPVADLRGQLVDFSFVIEGEPVAGSRILEVTNVGTEPHEMVLLKLAEGVSIADVMEMMMAETPSEGPPPFEFGDMVAPLGAGLTAWYEFELAPGDYGLICFIPSPDNEAAPHFMLGMTGQFSVAASETN